MPLFVPGQHIHIVGIGGFGMSALARILLQQGYYVSGSDRRANALTQALADEGAQVHIGEDAQQVMGAEMLLISSAVPPDHVEVTMANALNIPVYKRSEVIADIMSGQQAIAVAGTHGKTTTASMIAHILMETGQDPSYIIGGIMRSNGLNAALGTGPAFVIEADEYDNMFHGLRPDVAVITNVEYDHPDFFKSPAEMVKAFNHFAGLLPHENSQLIACVDDATAAIIANNQFIAGFPVATYGIDNPQAAWRASNIHLDEDYRTVFDVTREGETLGSASMRLPGEFNVLNALAALIAADQQGVAFDDAASALGSFQGAGRRFHARGEVNGVLVVDDYAHHPSAIRVNLEAAKIRFPGRTLWAVWQPHTYSRLQHLWDSYLRAFDAADHVLVTDVYAAREEPLPGISAEEIVEAIRHDDIHHTPSLDDAVVYLDQHVAAPAVVLIMSAGDAPLVGVNLLKLRQG